MKNGYSLWTLLLGIGFSQISKETLKYVERDYDRVEGAAHRAGDDDIDHRGHGPELIHEHGAQFRRLYELEPGRARAAESSRRKWRVAEQCGDECRGRAARITDDEPQPLCRAPGFRRATREGRQISGDLLELPLTQTVASAIRKKKVWMRLEVTRHMCSDRARRRPREVEAASSRSRTRTPSGAARKKAEAGAADAQRQGRASCTACRSRARICRYRKGEITRLRRQNVPRRSVPEACTARARGRRARMEQAKRGIRMSDLNMAEFATNPTGHNDR